MTERLRLEAEFRDRGVSAGIRRIANDLGTVKRTPGMEAATHWMEQFTERSKGFALEGGGVAGVMSAMGVGALATAGSLAELVRHFKEVGERTLIMKELGRETGLTVKQMQALTKAAEGFHVSSGAMQGAIANFKGQMPDFLVNDGPLWKEIHARFPQLTAALKRDANDTMKQVQDIFSVAGQDKLQRNPQLQKSFLSMFFGTDEMEKLEAKGPRAFMEAVQELNRTLPNTKALEDSAEKLDQALTKFNDSVDRFEMQAGPKIIGGLSAVVNDFNELFKNLDHLEQWWDKVKGNPGQILKDTGTAVGGFLHNEAVPAWLKDAQEKKRNFGLHSAPQSYDEGHEKLTEYERERSAIQAHLDQLRSKSRDPEMFQNLNQSAFDRIQELTDAINELRARLLDGSVQKSALLGGGRGGALFQNAAFGDEDGPIAAGVKAGMLGALREWAAGGTGGGAGTGQSGSMLQNASYETGGGGGGGFKADRGGKIVGGAGTFDTTLPREARAFLDDIASGEAPGYNVVNGGARFSDFSRHPGGRAAGRYQDLASTWRRIQSATGVHDFSPASQDKGNWWLAQSDYKHKTGRDLLADLKSGDPARIDFVGRALHSTWVSTNGSFGRKYQHFLGAQHDDASATPRRRMNLQDVSPRLQEHKITHDGGADLNVRIRSDGTVAGVQSQARGLIRSVRVNRFPQMTKPSSEA